MPTPAPFSLIWFAGMIELIAGALLLLGLFTRIAAFILYGEMAFAHFIGHFLSTDQWRRVRGAVLLHIPLSRRS